MKNRLTTAVLLIVAFTALYTIVKAPAVEGRPAANKNAVAQKVVPIISVGSGTRVGGALVTGEAKEVKRVVAVGQLEGTFQDVVRVRVLIPVSTQNVVSNIRRVPGTSVSGLVDLKL